MVSDHPGLPSSIRRLTPFPADAAGSLGPEICQQKLLPAEREPRKPWKMAALFFSHIHWPETGALWLPDIYYKHNQLFFFTRFTFISPVNTVNKLRRRKHLIRRECLIKYTNYFVWLLLSFTVLLDPQPAIRKSSRRGAGLSLWIYGIDPIVCVF